MYAVAMLVFVISNSYKNTCNEMYILHKNVFMLFKSIDNKEKKWYTLCVQYLIF